MTKFTSFSTLLCIVSIFATLNGNAQSAQAVTKIITDYSGYWESSNTNFNPVKPDNSHNLLAFTFGGTTYSTGVNDSLLTANTEIFTPGLYQALPIGGLSAAATTNTKAGLGQMYDGVDNGPSVPAPVNNIPLYLTDGIKGLNLGTGIANLPIGTLSFSLPNLNPAVIGDGIPDVLITQVAQPSGGVDYYKFTDINNNVVGDSVNISFSGIDSVGNWTADFYEASQNPMTLATGFTKTDRPIRLWAADLSHFGITAANYTDVKNFVIKLNGNSDVAFIAINENLGTVLPVNYAYFQARAVNNDAQLLWETLSETNSDYFEIQTGTDGKNFSAIGRVSARGNSAEPVQYQFTDKQVAPGKHFYRLKQVDKDGRYEYSMIRNITINGDVSDKQMIVFPNPANKKVRILLPANAQNATLNVLDISGKKVWSKTITAGEPMVQINLDGFAKGTYFVEMQQNNGQERQSAKLVIE